MSWLMYSMECFIIIMLLIVTFMSILLFYRQAEFRNRQTLFAIIASGTLASIALFLIFVQVHSVLHERLQIYILFIALFFLMMTITQSGIFNRSAKGLGRRIYRIGLAVFSILLAIFAVIGYLYNL